MCELPRKRIITTIQEKCKTCFTCVRECPAKAISIISGQAEVLEQRCIHCGNCVKVCSQKAKKVYSNMGYIDYLLASENKVAAIIAPSFPAEFIRCDYRKAIGALKKLGFDYVNEVGFGADLVAQAYKKILLSEETRSYIATSCPAVVSYVEKYYPDLVDKLAPVVSPMIATARVLKKIHGNSLKVVFIGPCIAKKSEIERPDIKGLVDDVFTFAEIKDYFKMKKIDVLESEAMEFDPPHAGSGSLFSISGGCLQAADMREDLISENVITANGKVNFVEAIREFSKGYLNAKILESVSCEGCIIGPGFSNNTLLYERRHLVSRYVRNKMQTLDREQWQREMNEFSDLDMSCRFQCDNQNIDSPSEDLVKETLARLGKSEEKDELNCGACGYETCRKHAIAILTGFAENEMCLPYTIEKLKHTIFDLEKSYDELKSIRETLDHREKLASMGQLSAGIAHELNNPLGVVLMYSHVVLEDENIPETLKEDLRVIANHASRCQKIVSGLLNFSRQNKLVKNSVDIAGLGQYCIDSIYVPDNIKIKLMKLKNKVVADIDKDQISQVIINLINNSIDAMEDSGGEISLIVDEDDFCTYFTIKDTGPGIPEKYKKQIFDPFFTTKQIGKGTGLGLSVSYGIVKMHSGSIDIETNANPARGKTGTEVKVSIPKNGSK